MFQQTHRDTHRKALMRQINSAELINFTKYMIHVYMYIYNLSLLKRNLAKLKEKPEKPASPTQ